MAGLGIELGDKHDMNRYFPILKDTKYGIRRIGILSLYGAGTAAITIDGVGKTPFKTHDEALNRLKFIQPRPQRRAALYPPTSAITSDENWKERPTMTAATIYDERIRAIIALLQRERDKQLEESAKYPFDSRGYEAAGFAFGMSYAIGALNACVREVQSTAHDG